MSHASQDGSNPAHTTDMSPERPPTADDTPAFAAAPSPVAPTPVQTPVATTSLGPSSVRKCEGCDTQHPGTYGSGRFCSATCAKKVGARHKWAARAATIPSSARRPPATRHKIAETPCESCAKLHDRTYGSGRFCSVHCARRVAATRKWEKSRNEKSKRLEAIRPAMLAPPPHASTACPLPVLTGKRRRLGRNIDHLHMAHTVKQHFQTAYPTPAPQTQLEFPSTELPQLTHESTTPTSQFAHASVTPHTHPSFLNAPLSTIPPPQTLQYTNPLTNATSHLSTLPPSTPISVYPSSQLSPISHSALVDTNASIPTRHATPPTAASSGTSVTPALATSPHIAYAYAYTNPPAYTVHHPASALPAAPAYSTLSSPASVSPMSTEHAFQRPPPPFHYPHLAVSQRQLPANYVIASAPAYDMDGVTPAHSPDADASQQGMPFIRPSRVLNLPSYPVAPVDLPCDRPAVENSESAARALLCLRATNS